MRRRDGTGLAELLVSLALAGVILAAATRGLVQHLALHRARDAQERAAEIVREVHDVLRAELAHAVGDVRVLGDTAVELASLRILARACRQDPARLVVPATAPTRSAPRAGDSLAVMDTLSRSEWRTVIAAAGTQRASADCPAGGVRLALGASLPASVPALAVPMRVWRTVRYVAYRAGDGSWWLGERLCTPGCGAAQPIAGPLLPPAQGGLRLSAVLGADGRTRVLDVSARAEVATHAASRSSRLPLPSAP
jgi:type II secretory pathway component PulJ